MGAQERERERGPQKSRARICSLTFWPLPRTPPPQRRARSEQASKQAREQGVAGPNLDRRTPPPPPSLVSLPPVQPAERERGGKSRPTYPASDYYGIWMEEEEEEEEEIALSLCEGDPLLV